jgi:hypothetical protein
MQVNNQYKQLLEQLYPDRYIDMAGAGTFVTIALEDMEFEGLIEAREPGSLEYRLTPRGVRAKESTETT